jgi:hypothetical protein
MKKYSLLVLVTCVAVSLSTPLSAGWTDYINSSLKAAHLVNYKYFLIKNKKIVFGVLEITGIVVGAWLLYKKRFRLKIDMYGTKVPLLNDVDSKLISSSTKRKITQTISQWIADQTTSFPAGVIQSTHQLTNNKNIYTLKSIYNKAINPSWTFVELRMKDQTGFLQFAVPINKNLLF